MLDLPLNMKVKQKKSSTIVLSDKIADALTVKPRSDIEDDQVFDTKPKTVSRADLNSSDSEDEAAVSDFRKRNINLLSDISKKYEGHVVSRKELAGSEEGSYEESDTEEESNLLTAKDLSLDDIEESADESDYANVENGMKLQPRNSISKSQQLKTKSTKLSVIQKTKKQTQELDSEDLSSNEGEDDHDIKKQMESFKKGKKHSTTQIKCKQKQESDSEDLSSDEGESDDYDITQFTKQIQLSKKSSNKTPEKNLQPITKSKVKTDDSKELTSGEEGSDDYGITQFKKQIQVSDDDSEDNEENSDEDVGSDDDNESEGEGYDISQMDEPEKEEFEHVKKQNVSEEVKKGTSVRNQLLLWEGLLEMRIHLQRCMSMTNQLPLPDTYQKLKEDSDFTAECNATKANIAIVLDK